MLKNRVMILCPEFLRQTSGNNERIPEYLEKDCEDTKRQELRERPFIPEEQTLFTVVQIVAGNNPPSCMQPEQLNC